MSRSLAGALLLLQLVLAPEAAGGEPEDPLSVEVSVEELTAHVRYLAGDELQGRRSGTPGGEKAAAYLAHRFQAAGLVPAGDDDTFLSWFDLPGRVPLAEKCGIRVTCGGESPVEFNVGDAWEPFSFSAEANVAGAEVVFAGYGIRAPDLGWDDYEGVKVEGRVVVILRRSSGIDRVRRQGRMHMTFEHKARVAAERGAVGVILVDDRFHHPESADQCPTRVPVRGKPPGVPFVFAKRAVTDSFLPGLPALEKEMAATGKPASRLLPRVRIDLDLALGTVRTANVVGRLPGSDPDLAGEAVVVGAHYDHLGTDGAGALDPRSKDRLWNGADDNASGTAGIIELAEHFSLSKKKPARSIVFVAFAAEEMGLFGSGHYIKHPAVPLAQTIAMLNMDMIGRSRGEYLFVGGTGTAKEFAGILDAAQAGSGLALRRGASGSSPSDNLHFDRRRIPTLFFFTGTHKDYHRVTDDWDKLNYPAMKRIVDVASRTLFSVANLEKRTAFVSVPRPQRSGAYMGITLAQGDSGPGALVESVMQAAPAAKGGMLDGDRIVSLGGDEVKTPADLILAIRKRKPGDTVKVVVQRGDERATLDIKLGGR